jgi:hypothetical protein
LKNWKINQEKEKSITVCVMLFSLVSVIGNLFQYIIEWFAANDWCNICPSFTEVEKYLPTEDGLPPLGNALVWAGIVYSVQVGI